jgi:hypothetical protein
MICHPCPLCTQPYGMHTDACPSPRVERPPEIHAERVEAQRAQAIAEWLRGGPVPASTGLRIPEERPLP